MGNPVEDGQYHKGLGMILASKHSEDTDKLQDPSSNEKQTLNESDREEIKSKPDLAATLQKSSTDTPSDRGYSYTEALFTGTPLFNGRPFTASDRTPSVQRHVSGLHITQPVKENDKPVESYNGAGPVEPLVDKNNDHDRQEGKVQIQKEIHTEEGVTGITVDTNPKDSQYHEAFSSTEQEHDTHSINKTPEKVTEHLEHQNLVLRPTLDESPYKPQSETLGNKEENPNRPPYTAGNPLQTDAQQGRHSSENSMPSQEEVKYAGKAPHLPTEEMHQILVTGQTQENFANSAVGSGQPPEENMVNHQLPFKTAVKSYDEESHLLGSSVYNHGHFVHQQADHSLEQRQEESNQKIIKAPMNYEKAQSLEQRQEESNQNRIEGPTGYGKTQTLSKDETSGKLNSDLVHPNGIGATEQDSSNTALTNSLNNENKDSSSSLYKQPGNRQTDISYEVPDRQRADQHRVQPVEQGANYDAGKQPNGKLNDSTELPMESSTPSKGAHGAERYDNQLRPHKLIESSFDEELAHRIITGPSYREDSQDASPPGEHVLQSASRYREGSNPSDFNAHHEGLVGEHGEKSVQISSPSSETAPLGSLSSSQKETAMQQVTSNQLPTSTVNTRFS